MSRIIEAPWTEDLWCYLIDTVMVVEEQNPQTEKWERIAEEILRNCGTDIGPEFLKGRFDGLKCQVKGLSKKRRFRKGSVTSKMIQKMKAYLRIQRLRYKAAAKLKQVRNVTETFHPDGSIDIKAPNVKLEPGSHSGTRPAVGSFGTFKEEESEEFFSARSTFEFGDAFENSLRQYLAQFEQELDSLVEWFKDYLIPTAKKYARGHISAASMRTSTMKLKLDPDHQFSPSSMRNLESTAIMTSFQQLQGEIASKVKQKTRVLSRQAIEEQQK